MHEQLIQDISRREILTDNDIRLCKELFQPVVVSKNHILEDAGKVPAYLYYIITGFMRAFYYNDNGDEMTVHINCPHGFFTAFSDFSNKVVSQLNVESVTSCQLLRISKPDYEKLMKESVVWKDYGMYVLQESMTYNEQRSYDLASLSAEQRYHKLMSVHPEILQNVPLQYIASFLGIKPETLSRIRRNLIN